MLSLLACLVSPHAAFGAIFNIDSPGDGPDSSPGDGVCDGPNGCTLRAAIQEANANTESDTIRLGAYDITLSTPGSYEDENESGDLDITSNLIIEGGGENNNFTRNIISGSGINDRVFHMLGGATVTISGVEILGGFLPVNTNTPKNGKLGGAGIYVQSGFLELNDVLVSDNRLSATDATFETAGGGLYIGPAANILIKNSTISENIAPAGGGLTNLGTTTIQDSLLEANASRGGWGGGIENLGGYLNISNTIFRSNRAAQGGAIFNMGIGENNGNVVITSTNIEQNDVSRFGGGIYNLGPMTISNSSIARNSADFDGGGIYNSSLGNIDITNTTISENAGRGGGGIYNTREITLTSSTVYNNEACLTCDADSAQGAVGGNEIALFSSSEGSSPGLTLSNTIVANGPKSEPSFTPCSGAPGYENLISSGGFNMESHDSCGLILAFPRLDQINVADIKLGELQLDTTNSSITPTLIHPLAADSPAVNSGSNTCPQTDQRFLMRDNMCDIGAYEYEAGVALNENLVDLKLIISDTPDPARPNDPQSVLTYTFTITNLYLRDQSGVTLDIQLPVQFAFSNTKVAASQGSSVSNCYIPDASNEMQCTGITMAALGRVDISVSGMPTAEATITVSAVVVNSNEAFPPNNSASESTEITRSSAGNVDNFGGRSGSGGGSLHPVLLLLLGGLFVSRRNRR